MQAMHKRFGKLSWAELVQPSIDLARNGVVLTENEARGLNRNRADFMRYNPGRAYMVKADSTQWNPGELFIQTDLATTLERILAKKSRGFYSGETADLIVQEMKKQGGLITHKDLKSYRAIWRKPLISQYKQYSVIVIID
jgi:gamma-glutamyltranspeptidase/glutathione hydrolase